MILLKDISETVQKVAEAIAAVLNVDVEIVGSDLVRVAGTGAASKKIGLHMDYGVMNKEVQCRKQAIIVPEPGYHEYCISCALNKNCYYNAQIIYPIVYGNLCIGSISLISFDKKQEKILLSNGDGLMDFLNRMADMISSKISERVLLEQVTVTTSELRAVINAVGQGIIAIDKNGMVIHFNRMAQDLLQLKPDDIFGKNIESIMQGSSLLEVIQKGQGFEEREIMFKREKATIRLLISAKPIWANEKVVGVVSVIQDLKSVGKFIYTVTGHEDYGLNNILGNSDSINMLKQQVQRVARSNSTVLIRGESGTGKELFARAIHAESKRNKGPFIGINCAAIPETLLESELFGYEEGSFTGAKKGGKLGKFELAQQGTLFLDEIGDMPLHLQVKLLRVLEEKSFERIGGISPVKFEARLITATNRDLESMVKRGEFREDFYYRLNVIPFYIPPLRERIEDIILLLQHFLNYYNPILNKSISGFTKEAETILVNYQWPGNIRELQNAVEYCAHMADGQYIEKIHLPQKIQQTIFTNNDKPLGIRSLDFVEKELIINALKIYGNSLEGKKNAAAALGIGLTTLYRKGKKYDIIEFSN
ncbi:MAG: sigma 54-interacting transcriptional regulator [Dehalobacterium sp.]